MFNILTDARKQTKRTTALEPELDQHHAAIRDIATRPFPFPDDVFHGRGIVTAAGGRALFSSVYVQLHRLRQMKCRLPVEVWYRGPSEMSPTMRRLLEDVPGVRCVDAYDYQRRHPDTWPDTPMNGFALKPYSIIHSRFQEVMFIDADNVPATDPSYLFDDEAYQDTGAIFWPDRYLGNGNGSNYRTLSDEAWRIMDLEPRDEAEFETGQMVIDKQRCWRALHLAVYLNQQSDFFYRWMHGDKDTFNLAWRRVGRPFAMSPCPVYQPGGVAPVLYQYDMQGRRVFQHRVTDKWDVGHPNQDVQSFVGENECHELKHQLQQKWSGIVRQFPWDFTPHERDAYETLMQKPTHVYGKSNIETAGPEAAVPFARENAREGVDGPGEARALELCPDFSVGQGCTPFVTRWWLEPTHRGEVQLVLSNHERDMAHMIRVDDETWAGRQVHIVHVPVALAAPRRSMD